MRRPQGFDGGEDERPAPAEKTPPRRSSAVRTASVIHLDDPATGSPPDDRPEHESSGGPVDTRELKRAQRARKKFERQEIRRFTQQARRRRAWWLGGLLSVAAVVIVAVLAAFSPLMSIRHIEVAGTSRVSAAQVEKALDDQLGKPIPLVDFSQIEKDLSGFTLIRSYRAEIHPPNTLVVRISERTPVALRKAASGYELVDAAGVVISTSKERPGGYPLIEVPGSLTGKKVSESFEASAAVIQALPTSIAPKVKTVRATSVDDVRLTLVGGQKVVWGGPADSEVKAADLSALLKRVPHASEYDVSSAMNPVTK